MEMLVPIPLMCTGLLLTWHIRVSKKTGVKTPGGKVEKCVSRRVAGFAFAKEMLRSLRV